jgi:hypothetical protein
VWKAALARTYSKTCRQLGGAVSTRSVVVIPFVSQRAAPIPVAREVVESQGFTRFRIWTTSNFFLDGNLGCAAAQPYRIRTLSSRSSRRDDPTTAAQPYRIRTLSSHEVLPRRRFTARQSLALPSWRLRWSVALPDNPQSAIRNPQWEVTARQSLALPCPPSLKGHFFRPFFLAFWG